MIRNPLAAITGRFQPFHLDHLDLVLIAASDFERLIIGITNPDSRSLVADAASDHRHLKEANPFSYYERRQMIEHALTDAGVSRSRFTIVPFPLDLADLWPNYIPLDAVQLVRTFAKWEDRKVEILRMAGYKVRAISGDPKSRISATTIRAAMASRADWRKYVTPGTATVLAAIGDDELACRCAAVVPDE